LPDDWVSAHLQRFCRPGGHSFIGIAIQHTSGVLLRCSECGKEEAEGLSCLVCTTAGEVPAMLVDGRTGARVRGSLCRLCADEFRRFQEIEGLCACFGDAGRRVEERG
jgi:hypothetical protein